MRTSSLPILFALALTATLSARDAYQVQQENKNHDAWREKAFFNNSSSSSSSSSTPRLYTPPSASKYDPAAAEAASRFRREQQRADDEYNARVARRNADIERMNAIYTERERLMALAQQGNVPAARLLAENLMNTPGTSEQQLGVAKQWMRFAARGGDVAAKQWVAQYDAPDAQTLKWIAEADARMKKAQAERENLENTVEHAEDGDVSAMAEAGRLFFLKNDVESQHLAFDWFFKAAQHNDEGAMEMLRHITRGGGDNAGERAVAVSVRDRLARLPGQDRVYAEAGDMHLTGKFGAKIDRALAIPPLEKASEHGDKDALFRIAEACGKGIGGPRDIAAALTWYRKAIARQDNPLNDPSARARFEMSVLMLDPESEPAKHASEILAIWDEGVLAWGPHADRLCILAREALASGQLGISDPAREVYYLSRAIKSTEWTDEEVLIKAASFVGNYVSEHAGDPAHPLHVIRKETVRRTVTPGGTFERDIDVYTKIVAEPKHALLPLAYSAQKHPSAQAFVAAGSLAASLTLDEIKGEKLQEGIAFQMFDSAATDFDDVAGWLGSGCILLNGWGVPKDGAAAQTRLMKAWEKGSAKAALYLAIIQQNRLVPNANDAEAQEWIRRGAEKSDPACMGHHGTWLLAKDDAASHTAGLEWLERAAAAGNVEAMANLAGIYDRGELAPKDEAKSLALLQTAIAGNSARAKAALADRLGTGRGVAKDQSRALQLLREAAPKDRSAANSLGVMLWRGDWGEKNVEVGLQWMEAALDAGNWPAGRNLAKIHHLGLGVPANEEKARAYLEEAGEKGGEEAARAISSFYAQGEIITKDLEAAQRWAAKATAQPGG